ncbi:MAG TPA: CbiQ family ECF transporter T component [Candidatus Eisenbacteria bacterium]|nr:CbiQ family ECF transporter T component [Candidatus Eisenbacteria bacterium]
MSLAPPRTLPAGAVIAASCLAALAVALAPDGAAVAVVCGLAVAGSLALLAATGSPLPGRREIAGLLVLGLTAWLLNAVFRAGPRVTLFGHAMPWSQAGAAAGRDTALRLVAFVLVFRALTRAISAREALALTSKLPGGPRSASLGVLLLVALRLAPALENEARRLQWQRALRGDWPGPAAPRALRAKKLKIGVRDLTQVTLPLFLLTLTRAEELAWALPARYYGLARRTPPERTPWTGLAWAVAASGAALAIAAAWARWGT